MITAIRATKKTTQSETEKGVPLAPSAKDLKPWYSERDKEKEYPEDEKGERLRYAVVTVPVLNLYRVLFHVPESAIWLRRL